MLNFFRRKPAPVAPRKPTPGVFSTDVELFDAPSRLAIIQRVQAQLQRPRLVTPAGVAMDSADSIAMDDTSGNALAGVYEGYANSIGDGQLNWYANQSFIGYQIMALMSQNWFISKACEMPAKDAVRNGWQLVNNTGAEISPALIGKIAQLDKRFGTKYKTKEFVHFGRLFGIRVAMAVIEGVDYSQPFNPDGIKPRSYKGMTQIDPYWANPMLDLESAANPGSIDFYVPTFWQIPGLGSVHKSHLIIYRNGSVPDILKPVYQYGGVSVTQRLFERVYAAERTANEVPQLALSKRSTVLHTDVGQAIANEAGFGQKMTAWQNFVNNFGVKVVGTEEVIEQFDTTLADMDEVIMGQFTIACAIAEVPVTRMMGTSAKGLNATGEGDEANYHEFLESIQEHDMTPFLERHYCCLIVSEKLGKLEVSVSWNELDAMTAKEQAEVNKLKADTDGVLVATGALEGQDVRDRLINDVDSEYTWLSPDAPEVPEEEDTAKEAGDSVDDAVQAWLDGDTKPKKGKKK